MGCNLGSLSGDGGGEGEGEGVGWEGGVSVACLNVLLAAPLVNFDLEGWSF